MKIQTSAPPFKDIAAEIERDFARAHTSAMRQVGNGLKTDLRDQIRSAFPESKRLANVVGVEVYPKGDVSLGAAVSVYVRGKLKWSYVFEGLTQGITIRATGRKWLAIPTPEVPKNRFGSSTRRLTPAQLEEALGVDLQFVQTKRPGVAVLVADRQSTKRGKFKRQSNRSRRTGAGQTTVIYYVLKRIVRLPKRTDPLAIRERWLARIPTLIDAAVAAIPRTR